MLIDIEPEAVIILHDVPVDLKSYQKSQMDLLGFQKKSGTHSYWVRADNLNQALLHLISYLDEEAIEYKLSEKCAKRLDDVRSKRLKLSELKKIGARIKRGEISKYEIAEFAEAVHKNIARKLKPHQLGAAYHLYKVKHGANFSVPGSGKTMVVLSVFELLRKEGLVNVLFVVGPPSCFGPWRSEFHFTLGRVPNYRILAGGNQALRQKEYYAPAENFAELYLTTFNTLFNDQLEVEDFFRNKDAKIFLVIDEAHYMKKVHGNWASAVLALASVTTIRCVLTGTPVPKSYIDIFNTFDFLWPERFAITDSVKAQVRHLEMSNDFESARALLRQEIGPLFYRVKKSDLNLMPANHLPAHIIEMNPIERLVYDAIDRQIRNYSQEDYLRNIDIVTRLHRGRMIRLRQCASFIPLLKESIKGYDEDVIKQSDIAQAVLSYETNEIPAKVSYLLKLLDRFKQEGRKVVIWANFIKTLEYLREVISSHAMKCDLIYGSTPVESDDYDEGERTRERIRDEFVDEHSGLDILLANPAACAESISLHKTCHDAVYYDLSYNCAQFLQSLDRIHRVGASETIAANYHFLQYRDTIEADIKASLDRKAERMYRLIEENLTIYSLDMFEEADDELRAYGRIFGDGSRSV